jgi:integrase
VAPLHLLLEDPVLLHQVLDDVLLVVVDPSREGHEQYLQGVEIGRHRPILSGLTPDPITGSGPAEFSDTTGKDRLALIGEDLAQLLRVHLGDRIRGPLFSSSRGTRLSVRRIQSVVRDAARKAGIDHKRISPHTFRHTWATLARNAGLPLDTVQALLGHANPRTTEIYARLTLSRAREEYDAAMRTIERPHAHHAAGPTAGGSGTRSRQ